MKSISCIAPRPPLPRVLRVKRCMTNRGAGIRKRAQVRPRGTRAPKDEPCRCRGSLEYVGVPLDWRTKLTPITPGLGSCDSPDRTRMPVALCVLSVFSAFSAIECCKIRWVTPEDGNGGGPTGRLRLRSPCPTGAQPVITRWPSCRPRSRRSASAACDRPPHSARRRSRTDSLWSRRPSTTAGHTCRAARRGRSGQLL